MSTVHSTNEQVGGITTNNTNAIFTSKLNGQMTGSTANLLAGLNLHYSNYPRFLLGGQLEGTFFDDIFVSSTGYETILSTTTSFDGVTTSTTVATDVAYNEITDELTSMFIFSARGGYLIKPNLLAYILGGGTESNFVLPTELLKRTHKNEWVLGYTVGGGLEYQINNKWSLRGEYRFLNFKIDNSLNTTITNASNPEGPNNNSNSNKTSSEHSKTDVDFNMGAIAIIYRPF